MEQASRSGRRDDRNSVLRFLAIVLGLAWVVLPSANASAQSTQPHAHVYLIRGFMNVFSLGMDEMAAELQRKGIEATVDNHSADESLSAEAAAAYKAGTEDPIILVGHSLGADVVIGMAATLGEQGVPVKLVIGLDPFYEHVAAGRVDHMIIFHVLPHRVVEGPDFYGELSDIDLTDHPEVTHLNIDKTPEMQEQVLRYIEAAVAPAPPAVSTALTPAPKPSRPAQKSSKSAGVARPSAR